ncbi:redoxin domain-containing protein [Sphingomonas sp. HITSZ_GF]|uniref:redoxin domain-containing protein n=1 Tax=Sphingomonas sp. HITSZ_GF TaxID=3037247 RepID=UPI00240DC918|nr:redoxin domain-containing protein [Sphingomonas sp. HITSZ_GF]MDG2534961.1 redoxin domain-containing protein [Sphingomonas sp. HITSZ_GF]
MKNRMLAGFAIAATMIAAAPLMAEPELAATAPNFRAFDMHGRVVDLSAYRGKTVVLEWNNPGCPYVKKHYGSGNMQKTQAAATAQGVVWLTINSGAPGMQGHMSGAEAQQFVAGAKAKPTAYLLDPKGLVGKGYGAKTTPHLYIIDGKGRLAYKGGIDDKPSSDVADIAGARNHVLAALAEMRAGKPVSVPETRPYGCSVKYAS